MAGRPAPPTISPRSGSDQTIEDEGRHATPEEQERLSRFTAFGACELANKIFRRAGESFAARLGRSRQRARTDRLARRSRKSHARHPIRPFHAGIRHPRHLAGAAATWDLPAGAFSTWMRDGPLLRPHAGSPRRQNRADRHRDGRHHRPDRKAPLSERPSFGMKISPRPACPTPTISSSAIRRSSDRTVRADDPAGPAPPLAARLFHRALGRAVEARRPRRLRHQPLDHGQDR